MTFHGLSPSGIVFYERLAADNSKTFWQEHRAEYVEFVKQPMLELTEELEAYGPFHMFRPHNDLRFSKSKPPYKVQQGAYGESEGGAGYYVQFSAEGLMVGSGYYAMAKDQLDRFRSVLDADATGTEGAALVADIERRGFTIGAIDELKSAPRGFAKDHPRIELIRRKGLIATKSFGSPKWIFTKKCADRVRESWEASADLCAWLDAHVGPSTLPPDDRPF